MFNLLCLLRISPRVIRSGGVVRLPIVVRPVHDRLTKKKRTTGLARLARELAIILFSTLFLKRNSAAAAVILPVFFLKIACGENFRCVVRAHVP